MQLSGRWLQLIESSCDWLCEARSSRAGPGVKKQVAGGLCHYARLNPPGTAD